MRLRTKVWEYLYGFMVITLVWQLVAMIAAIPVIPTPIQVYGNLIAIFPDKLWVNLIWSFTRVLEGIAGSLLLGLLVGFAMGYVPRMNRFFSPIIYFTYPVPKLALLPIVMLVFGLGESSKIIMIMLIVIFQIIVSARDAVKSIPVEMYHTLQSLGASRTQYFTQIVFPATLAEVMTSTRLALGTAISILFFTETFGTEYGMGYFIMDAWTRVNYVEMYSGIVVLSILGVLLFAVIDIVEYYFCSWR